MDRWNCHNKTSSGKWSNLRVNFLDQGSSKHSNPGNRIIKITNKGIKVIIIRTKTHFNTKIMVIMHPVAILRTITRTVVVVITITTIILNQTIRSKAAVRTSKILIMANTNKMAMVRCSKIRSNRIMVIIYNKTAISLWTWIMETVNKPTSIISKANRTIMVPKIIKDQTYKVTVAIIILEQVVETGTSSILKVRISNQICTMSSNMTWITAVRAISHNNSLGTKRILTPNSKRSSNQHIKLQHTSHLLLNLGRCKQLQPTVRHHKLWSWGLQNLNLKWIDRWCL